ncbi:MAG: alpha/beta-type small acid-soluble spore protein [Clostridia bacterium]|nr:alpha/beta-type small acid-soluble spore protein [Clostridia bacterium]
MSNSGSKNRVNVPEAKSALDKMKFEVAQELGINLKQGYNGDLSSRDNGYVGGYMVRKMIEDYEKSHKQS